MLFEVFDDVLHKLGGSNSKSIMSQLEKDGAIKKDENGAITDFNINQASDLTTGLGDASAKMFMNLVWAILKKIDMDR